MRRLLFAFIALLVAAPLFAQAPPGSTATQAQLRIVVVDQTGAGIPAASVVATPVGLAPLRVESDERGVATIPGLPAGTVQLKVEFPGFLAYDAPLTVRRGANNLNVTLNIEGFQEQVRVDDSATTGTGNAETSRVLDQTQIDQLPEDPEELQTMLEQMAGGLGATFRVNGFSGGRLPNREDIRQIRFRTNSFAADNHDAGRVQIEIVTRPNVRTWNGNMTFNFRNDALNARNAFASTKAPQDIKRGGGGIRGPIVPGKTSLRINVDRSNSNNAGNIFAINPDGSRFIGFVSSPNRTTGGTVGIEHALTNNQTLRVEYQRRQQEAINQGVQGFNLPERATNRDNDSGQARIQIQGLIGRSTLNEFHVEFNHAANTSTSVSQAVAINVLDAFNAGGAGVNSRANTKTFEVADNVDFTIGRKHAMRVGFLLTGGTYKNFDSRNAAGTFTFSSLEAYLAGTPLQFTQRIGEVNTSFSSYESALYWQDDYRATRTLTLSFGVRQEMQSLIDDKINLMPRLGVTYSPRNAKTILRGGYGLFYDWYDSGLYDQTLRVNGISQRDLRINCPGFPDPFVTSTDAACLGSLTPGVLPIQPGGRIQASPDLQMPYVHQASVGVERPIGARIRTGISFQMLRGRNQMRARDINTPDPATGLRPEPTIGSITQFESTGESQRDAMNVNFNYSLPQPQMNFGLNYMLSQFKNHADGATQLPVNSYNPDLEWGPSSQDIRHRLTASVFLPPVLGFRTSINGLVYQSAAPYNITTGRDDNRDLTINDRPLDANGNMLGRNSARGSARWGDFSMRLSRNFSFGVNPATRTASASLQGPGGGGGGGGARGGGGGGGGFAQGGRFNVDVFASADNVLNRVNYGSYAGTMTSRLFGQPTSALPARQIQVGMSFRF